MNILTGDLIKDRLVEIRVRSRVALQTLASRCFGIIVSLGVNVCLLSWMHVPSYVTAVIIITEAILLLSFTMMRLRWLYFSEMPVNLPLRKNIHWSDVRQDTVYSTLLLPLLLALYVITLAEKLAGHRKQVISVKEESTYKDYNSGTESLRVYDDASSLIRRQLFEPEFSYCK